MGKPFKSELSELPKTLKWLDGVNFDELSEVFAKIDGIVYFVGSGGSTSACHLGVKLLADKGCIAKAITPLELQYLRFTLHKVTIVFISASGKNTDIILGFKTALKYGSRALISICMTKGSKLAKLSEKYSTAKAFEYPIPSGKDGFLATNSLVAFFYVLNKTISFRTKKKNLISISINEQLLREFLLKINTNFTLTVLYGGWSKSVAFDIESKCAESALFPIQLTDFRNFGHGRHHWFAKNKSNSGIICLTTSEDEELALKTINALPDYIPVLILNSKQEGGAGAIELLQNSFYCIQKFGDLFGIDPGRPGVPSFGRKLYNLNYSSIYTKNYKIVDLSNKGITSIQRKLNSPLETIALKTINKWKDHYFNFINTINKTAFGAIVFDYDGTICSEERKFIGPDLGMKNNLNYILKSGFPIGIATGRGKSVRKDLQKTIQKKYWHNVIIAYYNGSEIGRLDDDNTPDVTLQINKTLKKAHKLLKKHFGHLNILLKPNQLSIHNLSISNEMCITKEDVIHLINVSQFKGIQIIESSHSVDIIPSNISKVNIKEVLINAVPSKSSSSEILYIGDKGIWPGNDYLMLNQKYSLSVKDVSKSNTTCWNVSPLGIENIEATNYYLSKLLISDKGIKIKLSK